jgi:hypothetical protein
MPDSALEDLIDMDNFVDHTTDIGLYLSCKGKWGTRGIRDKGQGTRGKLQILYKKYCTSYSSTGLSSFPFLSLPCFMHKRLVGKKTQSRLSGRSKNPEIPL